MCMSRRPSGAATYCGICKEEEEEGKTVKPRGWPPSGAVATSAPLNAWATIVPLRRPIHASDVAPVEVDVTAATSRDGEAGHQNDGGGQQYRRTAPPPIPPDYVTKRCLIKRGWGGGLVDFGHLDRRKIVGECFVCELVRVLTGVAALRAPGSPGRHLSPALCALQHQMGTYSMG